MLDDVLRAAHDDGGDAVFFQHARGEAQCLVTDGTVGNQDRGVGAVCLAPRDDLRTILLERHAMASIRRRAVEARRNGTDAAFGRASAQLRKREVSGRVLRGRVLAVDGDMRDAKVMVLRRIAGVDGVELRFRVVGRAGSLVARARLERAPPW